MKNKKGMFFTIVAIMLLSIMAVSMTIVSISHERTSITKRINTLNDYVYSFEKDLPRKLYISGFRMIFLYEKRMLENGTYLTNVNELINETFFNGTIYGTASSDETQLLSGVLYQDIIQDLEEGANKVNLNITITKPQITIKQNDPWNINVSLEFSFLMQDKGGLASWNRTANLYALIPIEKFEDPIYLIETNGVLSHKITRTPFEGHFTSGTNVTNLTEHVKNKHYIATNKSPSFINRLEGNLSANDYGIESLVYLPDFTTNGIPVLDKSVVDHIYFSTTDPSTKQVSGMPSWFKIDANNEERYNVTGLVI